MKRLFKYIIISWFLFGGFFVGPAINQGKNLLDEVELPEFDFPDVDVLDETVFIRRGQAVEFKEENGQLVLYGFPESSSFAGDTLVINKN